VRSALVLSSEQSMTNPIQNPIDQDLFIWGKRMVQQRRLQRTPIGLGNVTGKQNLIDQRINCSRWLQNKNYHNPLKIYYCCLL